MCEKKIRKITRGSQINRQREARRFQRIHNMTPSPSSRDANPGHLPPLVLPINKAVQNKVILELAWKTVVLMHKNKIIQQKIIDLQRETSEFVATVMKNPESRLRYMDRMRARATAAATPEDMTVDNKENIVIKTEPTEPQA